MVALCPHKVKLFYNTIMITSCKGSVIVPTSKIQTGLRFEAEMLAKITYIAKKNRRSLNAQLEFLTERCIEEYEAQNEEIIVSDDDKYR
jgi:hypothetical protein